MNAKAVVIALAAVTGWLLLSLQVFGASYLINPDGSGTYGNIQAAIDAAVDGDSILLADGTFTGRGNMNMTFSGKKIVVRSLSGNAEACIIDVAGIANGIVERGITFENNEDSLSILRDLTIINGSADAPCPGCEGGGLYIQSSSPTIINVICRDNYGANGAGLMIAGGSPKIINCTFKNNTSSEGAGLMGIDSCRSTFVNCLISGNGSSLRGGGISFQSYCDVHFVNCTISNNQAPTGAGIALWESDCGLANSIVSFNGPGPSVFAYGASHYDVNYSDVFGNVGGDWVDSIAWQQGINGNICANPLYADTSADNFHLTQNSPCINTGNPSSPYDPDGTVADMGAFYFNQTSTADDPAPLPFWTAQNYPNPFNARTTIAFSMPNAGHVKIDIYNLLGQNVATFAESDLSAGYHQVVWDANNAPSGLYFYRISTVDRTLSGNMLLLK